MAALDRMRYCYPISYARQPVSLYNGPSRPRSIAPASLLPSVFSISFVLRRSETKSVTQITRARLFSKAAVLEEKKRGSSNSSSISLLIETVIRIDV